MKKISRFLLILLTIVSLFAFAGCEINLEELVEESTEVSESIAEITTESPTEDETENLTEAETEPVTDIYIDEKGSYSSNDDVARDTHTYN